MENTKLNKKQLSKVSSLNIKELNILLSLQIDSLFKKMNAKNLNRCPICGSKIRYEPLKSSLKEGNIFHCDSCGKINPFDLLFCYNLSKELNEKINLEKMKNLSEDIKKPIFDASMKVLYKMVANKLIKDNTTAEIKFKRLRNELKEKEQEELEERLKDSLKPRLKYAFEKFNEEFGTKYKSNFELLEKSKILETNFLKFELTKEQLKDLYFKNPSFYALKNFNFICIKNEKNEIVSFIKERKEVSKEYPNRFSFLKFDERDCLFNIDEFSKTEQKELFIVNDFETIETLKNKNLEWQNVVATLANNYSFRQEMSLIKFFRTKIYICLKNENISIKLKHKLDSLGIENEILTFEKFKEIKSL